MFDRCKAVGLRGAMFTWTISRMSYQAMESRRQGGIRNTSAPAMKTTRVDTRSRALTASTMMRLVLTLCVCSLPAVHPMSIRKLDTPPSPNNGPPTNDTARDVSPAGWGEEGLFSDAPPGNDDTLELLGSNAVLERSYAVARAGCSNMSSAHLLKARVERLRQTANGQVDLVFLVDSSTSVGITDFFNELKFVRKLLAGFEVAEWATRVAVITFASRHRVVVNIDHLSRPSPAKHKCSLLNAELPGITYVGGGTYTLGAFQLTQKVFSSAFTRPNATQAVFLITDGYSNGGDPRPIAQNLIQNDVEIFTFGIRNGNVKELHAMASEPKFQHCYMLESFEEFESLARRALHEDLHVGEFVLESTGLCSSLCPQGGHCCHPAATCRCGTTTGQYECICPQGYHGSGIVGGCHACPAGTYKPQPMPGGISTCTACPDPNHTSQPASTNVTHCTCRPGYQAVPGQPDCQMIKCPLLSPPSNGFFVSGECSNAVHSACALRCAPGYELTGRAIMVCGVDGAWSDQPPICSVKKCHPLHPIQSGTVRCTKEDYSFDTECTTLCNRGYILVGSRKRRCLPIALWDGLPSACRAVTCPPLEAIHNASLEPGACSLDRQAYGTECTTVCHPGYQLKDPRQNARRCLASGMWSQKPDQLNVCTDVTAPDILCPDDIAVDAIPNDSVANVSWSQPLAIDNSGEEPAVTVDPAVQPPWLFPIGDSLVTYSATDKAGNTASCSFNVQVIDSQPPVIEQCHSPGVVLATDDHDQRVAWDEPRFSDNSGRPVSVARSHSPGVLMSWGTTNVEYIASDETGNTKSCHITVNVQQSACIIPKDPRHGSGNCQSTGGSFECSPSCDRGYAFPIQPESVYRCSPSGEWTPSHSLPWEDCSKKEHPYNITQPVKVTFPVHFCNQDLADEVADNIRRTQENKVNSLCRGPIECRFAGVRVNCRPKGSLIPEMRDYQGQRQQLRGDMTFERQQLEKLKKFPSLSVDMNVTGKLNLPEGATSVDKRSYQELRSSLSGVSNSLLQSLVNKEGLPLEMGAQTDTNSLVILPADIIPVCRPGSVVEFNECLQCAAGTFYNEQTSGCEHCPQGTYQGLPGQLQCQTCPAGTSTVATRAYSLQDCKDICSAGSHSDTGLDQCETCPRGTYQPLTGSTDCLACPAGTSTPKTGATSAKECLEPCKQGYVSRSGLVPCLPCPDGHYQPGISKTSCYRCPLTSSAVTSWSDCIGTAPEGLDIGLMEVLPFSDCFSSPCAHQGTCAPMSPGYRCICNPGYTGLTCDTEINECDSSPCKNDASCLDLLDGFVCICPPGFQGETCSLNIDECQSHNCLHDGTCVDGIAGYQCVCARGYSGEACEVDVNECLSAPCYHGARCVDGLAGFTCDCLAGYYGTFCEMETNECQSDPCLNGATCHDQVADFRCNCAVGFTGARCQVNIDECASSPCRHAGTCVDAIDGYQCSCQHGFTGSLCDVELPWDFTLRFDHPSTTDYVLIGDSLPDLQEVTAAFWMRSDDVFNYGSPFSYGAQASNGTAFSNAFTLMDYSGFVLYIGDSSHVSDVTANDGIWHHIAVTWTSQDGAWVIYKDGQVADRGEGLSDGTIIPGGGVFVIGQEQDSVGGDFASSEAFLGELTLMHVWGRALSAGQVQEQLRACRSPAAEGALLAWPDFLFDMYGAIGQEKNYFCVGCYEPLQPDYGDYTGYQSDAPLNVVHFACERGFEFHEAGYQRATCMISGDWLPYDPPVCRRKQCWFPGDIQDGRVLGSTFSFQSQVHYVCQDGYALSGPDTRECLDTGLWSDHQSSCIAIECGEVPIIAHAFISSPVMNTSGAVQEVSVAYHCEEGYRLQGPGVVVCNPDSRWSQLPECRPPVCPTPDRKPHSAFTSPGGHTLGATVTYNCHAGYRSAGSLTRTCQADATWSGASPACAPLQCGPPPAIEFAAYSSTSGFAFQSVALYSCAEGYRMHGNGSLRCELDLMWVGEFLQCLPVPCPDVWPIRHGFASGSRFHYGESVTYACEAGYRLNGPGASECLAAGTWNNSAPVCSPVSCGPPSAIQNGGFSGVDFDYTGVAQYLCDIGFVLIGDPTVTCGANGRWSGSVPHCEAVTCSAPPGIEHADAMPSSDHEPHPYQANVTFLCHVGYVIHGGGGSLKCGPAGRWLGDAFTCEAVACDRLGSLPNGRLIRTGHSYNDTATYVCHEGFHLVGEAVRVCQADGLWNGAASQCRPVSCSQLPAVPHAKVSVKSPNESTSTEGYPYKTRIRYRCLTGYQLHGDQEQRCGVDGEWSAALPACRPIRCHDLPTPAHGQILGSDLTFNRSVAYRCDAGYRLVGQSVRTCLADGTWDGDFPMCEMVSCGQPDRPPNGQIVGNNFLYQGVVTYSCDRGYILIGDPTLTCLATGQWSSSPPLCRPADCGPPPPVPNAVPSADSTLFGALARYACRPGYGAVGDQTMRCGWKGEWEGRGTIGCSLMSCDQPPALDLGFVEDRIYHVGDTAEYACVEGALLRGNGLVECLPDRTWTATTDARCELIVCPELPAPSHGGVLLSPPERTVGSVAAFACDDGYSVSGPASRTCLASGRWDSAEIPSCERVSCPPVPSLRDGTAVFQGRRFTDVVSYRCKDGYRLVGDAERRCLANSSWDGVAPVCTPVSCGVPNPIDNGLVTQKSEVFYGGEVTYSCEAGYELQGSAERFCTSSGSLSDEEPSCEIITCRGPPAIRHAVTSDTDVTYGSLASYQCMEGYRTDGRIVIECLWNGSWGQTTQECLPVSCGRPIDIENGDYTTTNGTVYMSEAGYHCNAGYILHGSPTVECRSDGQWDQSVPSCRPVSCGLLPPIPNGSVTAPALTYPSDAQYSCDTGYVLVGSGVSSCLSNGSWSSNPVVCSPVSCGQPEPVSSGKWHAENLLFESRLTYTCDTGHELVNATVRTCTATGQWSGQSPICRPVRCPPLSHVENGMVLLRGSLEFQSVAEFSCDLGYQPPVGDLTRTCQADGTWSGDDASCRPVSCGSPPDITNAYMPRAPATTFNMSVEYRCRSGYQSQGHPRVTCLADGSWSALTVRCELVDCGELPSIPNGGVSTSGTSYGSVAEYACSEGYRLLGGGERVCQANRAWSSLPPTCLPIPCGLPPGLQHAIYLTNDLFLTADDYVFGTAVQYTCVEGYQLRSTDTVVCQSDGTWNSTDLVCQVRRCPSPPEIDDGRILGQENAFRSVVRYVCDPGYQLLGSSNCVCQANETWLPPPPTCAPISCPAIVPPPHSQVVGTGRLYRDALTFRCLGGLQLHGESRLACTAAGTWDHPIPSCAPKSCGPPPSVDNGMIFGHTYQPGDTISYQCNTGYLLDGPSGRRCLPDYRWSGADPKCIKPELSSALNQAPPCIFPCLHGGTCVGPYQCSCPYGFAGSRCEIELCARRCIGSARCTPRHPACK